MPLFAFLGPAIAALSSTLARFMVPYILIKLVAMLGLSVVTFVGLDLLSDYLVDTVRSNYSGLPADLLSILALIGVFDWIEVVMAAWVAAINIRQLRGSFKFLKWS